MESGSYRHDGAGSPGREWHVPSKQNPPSLAPCSRGVGRGGERGGGGMSRPLHHHLGACQKCRVLASPPGFRVRISSDGDTQVPAVYRRV